MAVRLLVLVLATWRITAILVYDDFMDWLRDRAKVWVVDEQGHPKTFWGKILGCFWCASILVGVPLSVLALSRYWGALWIPAASGAAILLNHIARVYLAVER